MSGEQTSGRISEQVAAAIKSEAKIAEKAAAIRDGAVELTPELFLKLYPLLGEPIPPGFIQYIPKLQKGKPYESTGVCSIQVQIDRMNNVLTPLFWWTDTEYAEAGKLAKVTVCVGPERRGEMVFAEGSSYGGVGQGSSLGNIYKGSHTNAGKLAFAHIGPGHEVYLGAADLDPDVNQEVAEQEPSNGKSGNQKQAARIGVEVAGKILDRADEIPTAKANLQLAVSHIINKDIGDLSDRERATGALAESLTFDQAEHLSRWVEKKQVEAEADVADGGGSGD